MTEPIYLNNAGTSWPKAPGVADACREALLAPPAASQPALQQAHAETCRSFGLEPSERLLLTGSCTAALALLLRSLPLQAGERVLTSSLEHHALVGPIQQLVLTRGIVHEVAPYTPGVPLDLDFVRRALRDGGVGLVAVTAASNVTGELLAVEELGRLTREHGVPLLVDAAQSAGVIPTDLRALPVDMLVFAAHKGPLAPHGIGGLWAGPDVVLQSPAAVCELSSTPDEPTASARSTSAAVRCDTFLGACDAGSVNLAAAAGLACALRWQQAQGGASYAHARVLASRLHRQLREQPGCRVFGSERGPNTATVSFLSDDLPLEHAEGYFAARGITLRAGQHCAPLALQAIGAPQGTLRVSFGPFNRDSDVEAVVAAVAAARRTR